MPKPKKSFSILSLDVLPVFVGLFTAFWILFIVDKFINSPCSIGALIFGIAFGLWPLILLILHRRRTNKT